MTLNVTILGCSSSGGVPRVGQGWGKCDPANPKNCRRRCSLLLSQGEGAGATNVLIDTSPICASSSLTPMSSGSTPFSTRIRTPTTPMASTTCAGSSS